ncbi:histidinol-phosphatase [Hoeflea sp. WL0058]|uniref:Histidinol-phosphatase n=1 Tax=Flavimaribacter sediminis TaxID=2865987 RepID=A0AAE2ZRJ7_9HYPH|nr:histidinol-phosphatase [Flavimaribacter sediminis]MBW8639163.1 histidinol-phosphatase [Flavimaribacter sediminis]
MKPDLEFLHRLADVAARETLPRFRATSDVINKETAGFDPVTEADRAAEAAIRALIAEGFPDHGILGEEHGAEGLDREYVWVIDPIDGTRAYISGVPLWGTLIGLYHNGRAVMGLMDQPFTRERYVSDGARCLYRGPEGERQLSARKGLTLAEATLFTTSPFLFSNTHIDRFRAVENKVNLSRYGCDCYAYALVAAGHADIVVESGLKPYDIAGLIPVLEGAGAIVTDWNGARPEQGGDIVAAGCERLHAEALELLAG